jgi:hypothetical protein
MRGVRYSGPGAPLQSRAFHLRIDFKAVRPDYDLTGLPAASRPRPTTEERFARRTLLAAARASRRIPRRGAAESALYYGTRRVPPARDRPRATRTGRVKILSLKADGFGALKGEFRFDPER